MSDAQEKVVFDQLDKIAAEALLRLNPAYKQLMFDIKSCSTMIEIASEQASKITNEGGSDSVITECMNDIIRAKKKLEKDAGEMRNLNKHLIDKIKEERRKSYERRS